ncbi:MAG TPA: RidA family protein [Candidatus Limnocylindrales bacterium]|nr:RidA family protein [Candidatus Limnocylindrales bacterium]
MSGGRLRISSGGPWEAVVGYSRAIVADDHCWVSGTTDAGPDGKSRHPGDVAGQTRAIFEVVGRALDDAGFTFRDVVRTRMFVTDISRADELNAVHRELFGEIRPASSLVEVSALIDPSLLVEIEVEARRG